MEPLLDKYYFHTPYHYCRNNPVSRIDGNGFEDDGYTMVLQQSILQGSPGESNSIIKISGAIGSCVTGTAASVATFGYGFTFAAGATSVSGALKGTFMMTSSIYGGIVTPIKSIGMATDNEEFSNVPTTLTGVAGHAIDEAIGNGNKTFENSGNILQNMLNVKADIFSFKNLSGAYAIGIDFEQLSESVVSSVSNTGTSNNSQANMKKKRRSTKSNNPVERLTPLHIKNNKNIQSTYEGKNAL